MARATVICRFLLVLVCGCSFVSASDPELLTDFYQPSIGNLNGSNFTFTGFRHLADPPSGKVQVTTGFVDVFPGLDGLGISSAAFSFAPGAIVPPHFHPRATELFFVMDGTVTVGFIDTTNKLFNQTLQKGDVFVFPKALVHFQLNPSSSEMAHAFSGFSSASPGLVLLPTTLFASGIPQTVLTQAFNIDSSTLKSVEQGL